MSTIFTNTNTVIQTCQVWFWMIRSFQEAGFSDLIGCCLALRRPRRCRRSCQFRYPTRKLKNCGKDPIIKYALQSAILTAVGAMCQKALSKSFWNSIFYNQVPDRHHSIQSKTISTRLLMIVWYYSTSNNSVHIIDLQGVNYVWNNALAVSKVLDKNTRSKRREKGVRIQKYFVNSKP